MISSSTDRFSTDGFLAASGIFLSSLFLLIYAIPFYWKAVTPFLAIYELAFAMWGTASWLVLRRGDVADGKRLWIIAGFALLFRAIVLPQTSILDDDLYRYIWDSRIWQNGINPYLFPPDHYALFTYRDEAIFPHINFPHVPTIYPPLAQFVFSASVTLFGDSLVGMKLCFVLFDVFTIGVMMAALKALGLDPARVIVYAWCPLTIKEVANSGHLDSLPVFFMAIAFWLAGKKPSISAAALGAAVAAKLYPLAIVPFFIRRLGWKILIAPVVIVAAYAPFLSVSPSTIFEGLTTYAQYWVFNSGLFDVIRWVLSPGMDNPNTTAKVFGACIVIAVILWRIYHDDGTPSNLSVSITWTLAVLLLVAPTADPWYLLWFLPFLCVFPSPGLMIWTGLSFLSYAYYYENRDVESLRVVEYSLVWGAVLWSMFAGYRAKKGGAGL